MDYQPKVNVTDVINEEHKQWNNGDIVFIDAGTGAGKSYFIRNALYELAQEQGTNILLLVNRIRLFEQNADLVAELNALDKSHIDLLTYQKVERQIVNHGSFDFSRYKYIVCDEAHYFTMDSSVNENTDESIEAILKLDNHVRIFMSATGNSLLEHIDTLFSNEYKLWHYPIERNFDHIESLTVYRDLDALYEEIEKEYPNDNEKIIHFCSDLKQAEELHLKYKQNSMFVCSTSNKNKKYHKYIDENKLDKIIGEYKFDCKYLFTTSVLDNGIDLKDDQIRLIICDILNIDQMLQCIGRKRTKNDSDKVHIVLYDHTDKELYNRYEQKLIKAMGDVAKFQKDKNAYINRVGKFGTRSHQITKDVVINDQITGEKKFDKKVSRPRFIYARDMLQIITKMKQDAEEHNKQYIKRSKRKQINAYALYVQDLFKQKAYFLDKENQDDYITTYLRQRVGTRLYKDQRKGVIDCINLRDRDNHQRKSLEILNAYLNERKIPYKLETHKDNRKKDENDNTNPFRGQHYWLIVETMES